MNLIGYVTLYLYFMHHCRILIVNFCLELNKPDQNQTIFYSESRHWGEYVQGDLATSHCLEYLNYSGHILNTQDLKDV